MSTPTPVALRGLSLRYPSASQPLFKGVTAHLPPGFTGVIGANGTGKTTLLRIAAGELRPDTGEVTGVDRAHYVPQRTDAPPSDLGEFIDDWSGTAAELRGRLGIETDFEARWPSLSHGERKRTQIAHALWLAPELLAIDEPTNHIDTHARELLIDHLGSYRGVGLIVSHDRQLLDELCLQCLWLEPPEATLFQGGYTTASEHRHHAREQASRERANAGREHARLQQEIERRRTHAANEHNRRSKRGLTARDSDAREKINRARLTDGKAGAPFKQLAGRAARARSRLDAAVVAKTHETGVWLPQSRSHRELLLQLDAGEIELGAGRILRFPRLVMRPEDRVAITGLNGAGKSSLFEHMLNQVNAPSGKIVAVRQELTAQQARRVLEQVRRRPKDQLGHLMTIVSRLGSRPQRLLDSAQPSPGEIRKLLLALGIARAPHLIAMDEPTNHLDLPSIEALENALADCPCGLLLVSHDQPFIERLTRTRWHIAMDEARNADVTISL